MIEQAPEGIKDKLKVLGLKKQLKNKHMKIGQVKADRKLQKDTIGGIKYTQKEVQKAEEELNIILKGE